MGGVQSKNYLQLSGVSAYVDAVVTTTLFIFLAVAYSQSLKYIYTISRLKNSKCSIKFSQLASAPI